MDFIHPSHLLGRAPFLFVCKKDGSLHLCIDFCSLNNITKKDHYPLPHISDLLDSPQKARFYTKIDLHHAYHLVHIWGWWMENCFLHLLQLLWMACHAIQTYKCACCFSTFYEWHLWRPARCTHAGIPRWYPHLFRLWRRAYTAHPRGTPLPLTAQPIHLHQQVLLPCPNSQISRLYPLSKWTHHGSQ